jgi:hypothetical protein
MDNTYIKSERFSANDNYWYSAESRHGNIYIGINRGLSEDKESNQKSHDVIQKAIALCRGEELIRLIEEWLDTGLILKPATIIPSSIFTMNIQSAGSDTNTELNEIMLGVRYEILEKLTNPSEMHFKRHTIETCSIQVKLVLSELIIDKEQYNLIKEGRVLLIPDSYEKYWRIKLIGSTHINMRRSATLSKDARTIMISNRENIKKCQKYNKMIAIKNDTESYNIDISIDKYIRIPLDYIIGWKDDNELILDRSLRYYKVDVSSEAEIIASGHLISIADGYGVYIHK